MLCFLSSCNLDSTRAHVAITMAGGKLTAAQMLVLVADYIAIIYSKISQP